MWSSVQSWLRGSVAIAVKRAALESPNVSSFVRPLSCSALLSAWSKETASRKFVRHNQRIYPPQLPDEKPRPAFVCHQKMNIKYSPDKMWYVATLIRGMAVDEAIKQLNFVWKKGAPYIIETILEAQQLAIERHNVEFKSNLWVAESFTTKGVTIKGFRRHAKARTGEITYRYCHYFVRLEEGKPPEHYRTPDKTPQILMDEWLEKMTKRKVIRSL
ncbi:mitochondrial ribosomal protein L22 [Arctopsyche grandis]|uniref:mitochondrial ribosomal protein L22 n=1 Tax=Arctopsyche grandis TaxID=121162 RepID=UPI00406D906D